MSKTAITHLFGCVCAVICTVMSFFTVASMWGAFNHYLFYREAFNVFAYPSILIFGVISVGTFFLTISAFADKIFSAIQSPVFHPVLRLVGVNPTTPPTAGHATSRRISFFSLDSWQLGGILAVLLFVTGLGWYHWHWLAGKILESCSHQSNDAILQPTR